MRKLLHRSLALLLATAVALLVAEAGLRLAARPAHRSTAVPGEHLSNWLKPDFRDRRYSEEKEPGTFRILAVGDSYTWGYGVLPEDAYPDRLERRLHSLQPERRFEVVNWSRPGWNTWEQWRSLRDTEVEWQPDLLLLGFVLNDAEPTGAAKRGPLHLPLERRKPESPLSLWLHRHSRLYSRLFEAAENLRRRHAVDSFYRGLYEGESWQESKAALRKLRRLVRADGGSMAVVVFPVFDPRLAHDYPYRELHAEVVRAAGAIGIPVLDLLPVYERMDPRRLAVDPFSDPHPNELAHRIAADAIAEFLLSRQLL